MHPSVFAYLLQEGFYSAYSKDYLGQQHVPELLVYS